MNWYVFDSKGKLLHTATSEWSAQSFVDRLYADELGITMYGVEQA